MGINSTFQAFVHSEVKTTRGFRLVEAYLSHRKLADKHSGEYSDYEVVEETESRNRVNATNVTAEADYTFTTSFEEMPENWSEIRQEEVMNMPALLSQANPLNLKRQQTYQTLSRFKPKGQHLDYKL